MEDHAYILSDEGLLHLAENLGNSHYSVLINLKISLQKWEQIQLECKHQHLEAVHKALIHWRDNILKETSIMRAVWRLKKCIRNNTGDNIWTTMITLCIENRQTLLLEQRSLINPLALPAPHFMRNPETVPETSSAIFDSQSIVFEGMHEETKVFKLLARNGEIQTTEGDDYEVYLFQSSTEIIRAFVFGSFSLENTLDEINSSFEISNFYVKKIDTYGYHELIININEQTVIKRSNIQISSHGDDKISDLNNIMEKTKTARVMTFRGIIREIDERPFRIRRKSPVARKIMRVEDETGQINLKLWGEDAVRDDLREGVAIQITYGAIAKFQGVYSIGINDTFCSSIQTLSPEEYEIISKKCVTPYTPMQKITVYRANQISELVRPPCMPSEISIKGKILKFKKENCVYRVCQESEHRKKLPLHEEGDYFCQECDEIYPLEATLAKFRIQFLLKDRTGKIWITSFDDTSASLLEMDAERFNKYKEVIQFKILKKIVKRKQIFLFTIKVSETSFGLESGTKLDYILKDIQELRQ